MMEYDCERSDHDRRNLRPSGFFKAIRSHLNCTVITVVALQIAVLLASPACLDNGNELFEAPFFAITATQPALLLAWLLWGNGPFALRLFAPFAYCILFPYWLPTASVDRLAVTLVLACPFLGAASVLTIVRLTGFGWNNVRQDARKNRLQYNLRHILWVMTVAAPLLAISRWGLPELREFDTGEWSYVLMMAGLGSVAAFAVLMTLTINQRWIWLVASMVTAVLVPAVWIALCAQPENGATDVNRAMTLIAVYGTAIIPTVWLSLLPFRWLGYRLVRVTARPGNGSDARSTPRAIVN